MTNLKKLFDAMNRGDLLAITEILFPKQKAPVDGAASEGLKTIDNAYPTTEKDFRQEWEKEQMEAEND